MERVRLAAARAVDEYVSAGGRGQASPDDRMVRTAAKQLLDAGLDPAHYARYACMQMRAGSRRVYPPMVFGPRALAAWIPELRSRSASWAAGPTYECTRERLRLYARRYRLDLLPA